MISAQEMLVGYSSYPTESITKNAKAFRELGLGYANLGAMLMAQGLPYDSEEGRATAAAVTAVMTGHAYATSAKIAERVGTFDGYELNHEPMLNVLAMHRSEVAKINAGLVPEELLNAAQVAWDEAVELGGQFGVRNSQASVLAPTGTIGFMMDCDTTGIEPDFSLIKTKKLVGGGTMNIVNQTVPRALNMLGYTQVQVSDILKYLDEEKTMVGAPHLRAEHLPVFATAMGDNPIYYMGHVKMMAAVQPFISGAISKTVNMPPDVSIEDVMNLYIEGWKLGLKAIAIYREGTKVAEPLKNAKRDRDKEKADSAASAQALAEAKQPVEVAEATVSSPQLAEDKSAGFVVKTPVRRQLPRVRNSRTFEFSVGGVKGFFTVGEYPDRKVGELFIHIAKQGSTLAGIMDAFAISISNGLQFGVPLKFYVKKYMNMNFAPSGITDDPDITVTTSLVDYIFRRLALEYLPADELMELGIESLQAEQQAAMPLVETAPAEKMELADPTPTVTVSDKPIEAKPVREVRFDTPVLPKDTPVSSPDAPLCYNCGNPTQRAGSCYVCTACGTTSGCS